MQYVLKAQEMKACDARTISEIGLPSLVLMERAALAVVEEIERKGKLKGRALIVAGVGNNGGDGLAIGRLLFERGLEVDVLLAGSRDRLSSETRAQLHILENLGFSIQSKLKEREYDIIVDALFGIGLSRAVSGDTAELISQINEREKKGAFVCSVDIPSGICADDGKLMGCAVRADMTVSFGFAKWGHLLYPGKEYTGSLKIRDIGIPERLAGEEKVKAFFYEKKDIAELLPKRRPDGNKGTFGKILLLAGSRDMCGACLICAGSILHMGAGMVKILSPECNREIIQSTLPEAMLYSYGDEPDKEEIRKALKWADVLVAGPGLGMGGPSGKILKLCLEESDIPMVLDADALNLISRQPVLKELIRKKGEEKVVMTPHPGELLRLLSADWQEYEKSHEAMAKRLSVEYGCTAVCKDAVTLTAGKGKSCINLSGNDAMATAGSGDALAGMIGALLAQGMDAFSGASLGVFLHGLSGEEAAHKKGRHGVLSGDIVKMLPVVLQKLCGEQERGKV